MLKSVDRVVQHVDDVPLSKPGGMGASEADGGRRKRIASPGRGGCEPSPRMGVGGHECGTHATFGDGVLDLGTGAPCMTATISSKVNDFMHSRSSSTSSLDGTWMGEGGNAGNMEDGASGWSKNPDPKIGEGPKAERI